MRAVIQRVSSASVNIENEITKSIGEGLVVFLAVKPDDTEKDIDYIHSKIVNLRIFEDKEGKMNLSVKDINGEILIISQFTLYGDCRKGRRPSFIRSGSPKEAEPIYNRFIEHIVTEPINIQTGTFQSYMQVSLVNDGPVTIILDSEKIL